MNRIDLLAGCLLTAFGLAMIFVIIPEGTERGIYYGLPPTFFPRLLASGLTLCAVGLTVQAARRLRAQGRGEAVTISPWNLLMFGLLVVVLWAGIAAIGRFGMVVSGPLLIAALMLLLAERNPLRILATATIPVAAVYALAVHLLHTPVP